MEVEYIALAKAPKEAMYLKSFLNDMGMNTGLINIFNANTTVQEKPDLSPYISGS